MTSFPFLLVDAFADRALNGNPCAVVLDADGLSDADMQRLALEFNQSETAFVSGTKDRGFCFRFFTPAEEIPLAGHPTIAAVTALIHTGRLVPDGLSQAFSVTLKEGPIAIEVEPSRGAGAPHVIRMTQRKPLFGVVHDPATVAPLFGLEPRDLVEGTPVQTVSTGVPQLMMMVRDKESLRKAHPPRDEGYRSYRADSDFFSPHLFCLGGETPEGATFARHFGVAPDIAEDFATGSATGGMAAYLWRYGHLSSPEFVAQQGHWLGRPAAIDVRIGGPREEIAFVQIGGAGVVAVEGNLRF